MKIQGWRIDRFGALHDHEVRDVPDGLTIICGPNGSGKSTLFAFLQRTLFGRSPHAAPPTPQFAPESGAGRIWCKGPDGAITITQTANAAAPFCVRRPDGQSGDDTDVEACFGGAENRQVGSLLAFNIDDLRAAPALTISALRSHLSVADAGRRLESAGQALKWVRDRLSALRQSAGEPQQLLAPPLELQAEIEKSTQAALQCCRLVGLQAQRRLEVEAPARAVLDVSAERSKYDTLVDLSSTWQEFVQARDDLAQLEALPPLPADFEQRLAAAAAERQAAQQTAEQLLDSAMRSRESGATGAGTDAAAEFRALAATADGQRARLRAVEETRANLMPVQSPTDGLIGWQHRLKEVVDNVRDCECEHDAAKRSVRELQAERDRIHSAVGPEPPTPAILDEWTRLIHHVRGALAGVAGDEAAIKRSQDQIAACSAAIRNLETNGAKRPSQV